ncbi:MAG: hypothetical protein KGL39_41270 [Patescibacteria group bacterium]|nr:hypothetical protein [Patescibacteria group bacterium]
MQQLKSDVDAAPVAPRRSLEKRMRRVESTIEAVRMLEAEKTIKTLMKTLGYVVVGLHPESRPLALGERIYSWSGCAVPCGLNIVAVTTRKDWDKQVKVLGFPTVSPRKRGQIFYRALPATGADATGAAANNKV